MRKISLFIFFCLFISACTKDNYTPDEKMLVDFLGNEDFFKTKSCIVIVPVNGCGNSTKNIIEFSKKKYKNEKIIFIYSAWDRQAKVLYKDIKDFEEHVIIDKNSELVSVGLVENKPVVFFIENNRINEKIKFDDSISDDVINRINDLIK